jgi:hypothetical protein
MSDPLASQEPLSQAQRVDRVCDRFEGAWQAGQRPRIEDYLGEVPEPERSRLIRELLPPGTINMATHTPGNGSGKFNVHQADRGGWVRVFTDSTATVAHFWEQQAQELKDSDASAS